MNKRKQKTKEKPRKKRADIEAELHMRDRRNWKLMSRNMITICDTPPW
jgi:hypothetical protein